MNMAVDMLHAVAVITAAFGAVPKLHIGVVRIGHTAYCALMKIPLLLFDLFGRLLEVDGLGVDSV